MGIYNVPTVVKEVYFGKTKGIQEIQKQFSKFRGLFINGVFKFSTKINIDPDLLAFNRLIEKEFGFKTFSLYVINDIYNQAYTMPIGLTPGKSMDATSSGFKLKSKNGYTTLVCISTGLLLNDKFSDEEILSILLHEIGHNFSQNIDKHTTVFFTIQTIVSIIHTIETIILLVAAPQILIDRLTASILSVPLINHIFITFGNKCRKDYKGITKVFDFMIGGLNGINSIFSETKIMKQFFQVMFSGISLGVVIPNFIKNRIRNMTPIAILSTYLGYNGERVSDNFATVYGFGPELSSALAKMEFSDNGSFTNKAIESVPLVSNLYKLTLLPLEIIATGFDCHPNTPSRIRQQIVFLEKELNKNNLDPKVKKSMLEDIKELEKVLDDNMFSRTQRKVLGSIKDPYLVSRIYCATVYKYVGGDIRDLFSTIDNNDQFDNAYEKYKKE